MKYRFIFCFLKADGSVQTDFDGQEIYYDDIVEEKSVKKAREKFLEQFMYDDKPEIVEIMKGE